MILPFRRTTLSLRRLAPLCATVPLATGLVACGTASSTSSFKGEQQQVAKAVSSLQSHASALEASKICSENLAAANVASLNRSPGGCKQALESQLKQIDDFEAPVESVRIAGNTATASVKTTRAGKKVIETLTLRKEGGKWRISGLS
jgi:hypothetical protein